MLRTSFVAIASIFAITLFGSTQSKAQTHQPYAGLQARTIKALSDRQLADLRAGRGMEMALAAELNGYPGPAHVIEFSDALALTQEQRDRVKRLHDEMKNEAVALGEQLIQHETDLDQRFSGRTITPAVLDAATTQIGGTQAQLRAAHLRYHLAMVEVLTPHQASRYSELRGYARGTQRPSSHPGIHQNSN